MRAVRGFRHFFGSRRGGHGSGITSDRKDGPIGEMSDDEASSAAATHGKKLVGDVEDEIDVDNECCICLIDMEERKFRGKMDCCDHVVCWCCIQEWAQTSRSCPICQRSYIKCKKTTPKLKKGRKHTKPNANGGKAKKQRSLWEKVGGSIIGRRFRSARPSPPSAQPSWSDMGDEGDDVEAGEEEVIIGNPMRDSRSDDEAVVAAAAAAAVVIDANANASSSDSDSGSRSSHADLGNPNNVGGDNDEVDGEEEEENDAIVVNVSNDDNPREPEEVAEASRVNESLAEAVTGVVSSSSSASTRNGEESEGDNHGDDSAAEAAPTEAEAMAAAGSGDEKAEEEAETPATNFIAEDEADRKGKEKELDDDEDEDEDEDEEEVEYEEDVDAAAESKEKEEEEWERKGSESDDDDAPHPNPMPEDDEL